MDMEFSPAVRQANIQRMGQEPLDIVVVGGGITGAGIARDAAMRGLAVALVEKEDFASGTSSKSARLVHGGLRYLEQFQFGLIRSASSERHKLRRVGSQAGPSGSLHLPGLQNLEKQPADDQNRDAGLRSDSPIPAR